MKIVSEQSVEKAYDIVESLEPGKVQDFVDNFIDNQPVLFTYVMAMGKDLINKEISEEMLFNAIVIWKAFTLEYNIIPKIPEEEIDKTEERNLQKFENVLKNEDSDVIMNIHEMLTNHKQPYLIDFIMKNYVDITDQEFDETDKDSHGTMFIVLFTVIDCLDSAVKRSGLRVVK